MKYIYIILLLAVLGASLFFGIREFTASNNRNTNINPNTNINQGFNQNTNQAVNAGPENNNINIPTEVINANIAVESVQGVRPEITRGNTEKKQVIFTFDAGSGIQSAQKILDTLKNHNLTATFFLTGKWIEKNPDLVEKMSVAGHEIFNHTYDHPHLTQISDAEIADELKKMDDLMLYYTNQTTKPYFRPPYGDRNAHVVEIAGNQGYTSVFWTVDALDWEESTGMTAAKVKDRIISKLAPGNIYLMHVGDNITGEILEEMIQKIQNQGYKIVSLTEGLK
ncbi:MAG: polysaccharide deacetylase family protein [Patescibacteria group bacterium]